MDNGEELVPFKITPDLKLFYRNGKEMKFVSEPIEPKILPLVKALNDTMLIETFSSCQAHYKGSEQKKDFDRNFADVRFRLLPGVAAHEVESLLGDVAHSFWQNNSPVYLEVCKSITSKENSFYFMKLTPKYRFDGPSKKRRDTDEAIEIVANLIRGRTRKLGLIKSVAGRKHLTY